jgi:hypothetical protein
MLDDSIANRRRGLESGGGDRHRPAQLME